MASGSSDRPLRLLLDTNVVVSGLLWRGPPQRLLEFAIDGEAVELFSSQTLLDELRHTLNYPKFSERIARGQTSVEALAVQYTALVTLVTPGNVTPVVAGDPDDDHVLAAALAARASLIVTGDRKHLLPIGSYSGIAIVTAREAIERVEAGLRSE